MFEDELTGLTEHEDFMLGFEDMELYCRRKEAERDIELMYAGEEAALRQEWEEQQADPLRAVCPWLDVLPCRAATADDDVPF